MYISPPGNFTNTSTTTSVIDNTTTLSSSEIIYESGATTGVTVSGNEVTTPSSKKPSTVLRVGDIVIINSDTKTVTSIVDNDNKFVVNSTFTGTPTEQAVTSINNYRRYFKETDSTYTCKLINTSLQTHFVFKIVTREEDIHSHMTSSNV